MEAFARIGASATVIESLTGVGLWTRRDGGMEVHGYAGLYADEDDKAMKETIRKERREAGRMGGIASGKIRVSGTQGASILLQAREGVDRSGSVQLLEEKKREADFGAFWDAYPRHDGKQAARAMWMKLAPDDDTQRAIAADIGRRCLSSQWLKDSGQFVPHARTYLSQRRWEDGFEERPRLSERTINVLKGFEEPGRKETA